MCCYRKSLSGAEPDREVLWVPTKPRDEITSSLAVDFTKYQGESRGHHCINPRLLLSFHVGKRYKEKGEEETWQETDL